MAQALQEVHLNNIDWVGRQLNNVLTIVKSPEHWVDPNEITVLYYDEQGQPLFFCGDIDDCLFTLGFDGQKYDIDMSCYAVIINDECYDVKVEDLLHPDHMPITNNIHDVFTDRYIRNHGFLRTKLVLTSIYFLMSLTWEHPDNEISLTDFDIHADFSIHPRND